MPDSQPEIAEATPQAEAVNAVDAQQEAPQEDAKTFDADYVRKLREEAASYRVKLREFEAKQEQAAKEAERAKLDEVERVKAELEDERKAAAELRNAVQRERDLRALHGKVIDPEAALKLADDSVRGEDGINADALLERYPFLAAPHAPARAPVTPGNSAGNGKDTPLNPNDFAGKPTEWIRANMHRLRRS